jgi:hypothetical protein
MIDIRGDGWRCGTEYGVSGTILLRFEALIPFYDGLDELKASIMAFLGRSLIFMWI